MYNTIKMIRVDFVRAGLDRDGNYDVSENGKSFKGYIYKNLVPVSICVSGEILNFRVRYDLLSGELYNILGSSKYNALMDKLNELGKPLKGIRKDKVEDYKELIGKTFENIRNELIRATLGVEEG